MSNIEADSIKQQIKTAESIEEILEIVDKVLDVKNEKIHELEEENTTLRKANNITKNLKKEVKIEDITQVINKSYEEFIENFIPKQKVKDLLAKIQKEYEKLDKASDEFLNNKEKTAEDYVLEKERLVTMQTLAYCRDNLEELLEESK